MTTPSDRPGQDSLRGRSVTVFGLGRFGGGAGVTRWLCMQGAKVTVVDQASAESLARSLEQICDCDFRLHLGPGKREDFTGCQTLVVNPAIPPDNPWVQLAKDSGATITTEIQLLLQRCPARVIGITGSVGKSTVTAMTGAILQAAGPTWVGGNIGGSLLGDIEAMAPDHRVVLELSSFQLEQLAGPRISPPVTLVTNLAPNHLDRHGTMEAYGQAKKNIFLHQGPDGVLILNRACHATRDWADQAPGHVRWFDPSDQPFDLDVPGAHNQANAQAAWAVARELGVDRDVAAAKLRNFAPLPHRLQFVAEVDGASWYNDSKCTTPGGAMVAVEAFPARTAIVIAGGYDKHVSFDDLGRQLARRARAVVTLGQTAGAIAGAVESARQGDEPLCRRADSLAQAVRITRDLARPGDAVLLSPACASYDMFDNYEQRGAAFVQLVRDLI
jgi:UDP-N-acetylmuramoylalanine--D-glutamate ligase